MGKIKMKKGANRSRIIEVIFFTAVFAELFIWIMFRKFGSLDELWIFNMGLNISRGLKPYSEVSIITTPLSHMISALAIKIFGKQLAVMRLLAVMLAFGDCLLVYRILCTVKVNRTFSLIISGFVSLLYSMVFTYDYNQLIMNMTLLALYIQLKALDMQEGKAYNFLISAEVIGAAAVFFKQTTGIFVFAAMTISNVLICTKKYSKGSKKIAKTVLSGLAALLIMGIIFLSYLLFTNTAGDFIRYCFIGIKEFDNKESVIEFAFESPIGFVTVVCTIAVLVCAIIRCVKKSDITAQIILAVFFGLLPTVYPIADITHSFIPFMIIIILLVYLLKEKSDKINMKGETLGILLTAAICLVSSAAFTFDDKMNFSDIKHYKFIPMDSSIEEQIKLIDESIVQRDGKTAILDASAVVYMIPLDIYNKDLDMFLKGNLGGKAKDILNERSAEFDYIYVLKEGLTHNWQYPTECDEEVRKNAEKEDEVSIYDVYKK